MRSPDGRHPGAAPCASGNGRSRTSSAAPAATRNTALATRCSAPDVVAPPGCAYIRSTRICRRRSAVENAGASRTPSARWRRCRATRTSSPCGSSSPTEAEDRLVLVTGDVPGHGLRQHMKKSALALTFDQKIAIVRDVLAALDHAHRSQPQVVHRNLTPDAVLVAAAGRALLRGFDYARAGADRASTIAEDIVDELDPSYQAPECYNDPSQASVAAGPLRRRSRLLRVAGGRTGLDLGRRHDGQGGRLPGEAVRVGSPTCRRGSTTGCKACAPSTSRTVLHPPPSPWHVSTASWARTHAPANR